MSSILILSDKEDLESTTFDTLLMTFGESTPEVFEDPLLSTEQVYDETTTNNIALQGDLDTTENELSFTTDNLDHSAAEPTELTTEEITTEFSATENEVAIAAETTSPISIRGKVSKVTIFKRPVAKSYSSTPTTTEPVVTISRPKEMENYFALKALESKVIDFAATAIISWKTSLMIILIMLLVGTLSYYRRRVLRLKAEIVRKSLGSSYNQSFCRQPSNAYTPTYFPRRCAKNSSKSCDPKYSSDSDYESRRSNCYSETYNSSLHMYESIDEHSNCHIYAEIPSRKNSVASIESKPNNYENNSTICRELN